MWQVIFLVSSVLLDRLAAVGAEAGQTAGDAAARHQGCPPAGAAELPEGHTQPKRRGAPGPPAPGGRGHLPLLPEAALPGKGYHSHQAKAAVEQDAGKPQAPSPGLALFFS